MKGVASAIKAVSILILIFAFLNTGIGKPPIEVPLQYGQFCNAEKIAGVGITDISTSISDSQIALGYSSSMKGNGDIEIDQENEYSQNARMLLRKVDALNDSNESSLNLYESLKLAYSGLAPLVGEKSLSSSIGARIKESFTVNEMQKEQTAFISSTGSKTESGEELYQNPVHTIGLDTRNAFNGTWGTDSKWHKKFSRDIKLHEKFSGKFEADKLIKFHEVPI